VPVYFHSESVGFNLKHKLKYKRWLINVIISENKKPGEINFIFVDDENLLGINIKYLNHNFYTDVITFDYCEGDMIAGDIYISVDRIKENAQKFMNSFQEELNRVMVHGVLHLLDYQDSCIEEKTIMRQLEDKYLALLD
jgi:rRNA maturation RNase YbeY